MTTAQELEPGWVPSIAEFASRLALVRNKLGWNAKEAALACGLPAQSWRNWESGSRPHDYAQVCQQIAERTGVNLEWLALGDYRGITAGYQGDIEAFLAQQTVTNAA